MAAPKTAKKGAPVKKGTVKRKPRTFVIECTHPVDDGIMSANDFETYLKNNIKVNGKKNNFGEDISLSLSVGSRSKVVITTHIPFSKRYLKYLTKKFLRKHYLRDYVRVVATSRDTLEVRYFQIHNDEDEDEEEESDE